IAGLGLFITLDFYRSYAFRAERSTIVSTLQKARSQSMDNIDQTRHGVRFQIDPLKYILFECASSSPQCNIYPGSNGSDISIDASYGSKVTSPSIDFDVIF